MDSTWFSPWPARTFLTGNAGIMTTPPTSPSPRTTILRLINRVRSFR